MAFAPNPFSTAGGLTRTHVTAWARANDFKSVDEWLDKGTLHSTLANEALLAALREGHVKMAERVAQAQWHTRAVFDTAWATLSGASLSSSDRESVTAWLLNHTLPSALPTAMATAVDWDDEALWERILERTPDCSGRAGRDLLVMLSQESAWWTSPKESFKKQKAWVNRRALHDVLGHGLKPSGSVWIGSMQQGKNGELLNMLLERANSLTTPRLRTAIVGYAQNYNLDPVLENRLTQRFFQLGLLPVLELTKAERKKGGNAFLFQELVLKDGVESLHFQPSLARYRFTADWDTSIPLQQAFPPEQQESVGRYFRAQAMEQKLPACSPSTKIRF